MTRRAGVAGVARHVGTLLMPLALTLAGCGDQSTGPGPSAGCSTPRSLARGQVQTISGAAALACVVVAGTTESSEYLVVTANAAGVQDDLKAYRVSGESGTGVLASRSAVAGASASAADGAVPAEPGAEFAVRDAFEAHLRQVSRTALGGRDPRALRAPRAVTATIAAPLVAGDTVTYRVGDALATNMCTSFTSVRAVVRAVGSKVVVAQDVSAPANGFSATDFAAITREFDTLVHPTDVQWFGEPSDINGDGKVTLLFSPAINRLTPPGSLGFVGGYFWLNDLLPRTVPAQAYTCPASNEQEIMYFMTPDPDGTVNGNRFTVPTVLRAMRGTVAHEYQHLINQSVRQARSAPAEVDWLNEGLSHLAEELVGRVARGYATARPLTYTDVLVDLDDFDAFFRQNLIRYRAWMARPDLSSPISKKAVSELAPRGAAWALLRFSIDQYAGGAPATFTRALVSGPQVDVANLEARTRVAFSELVPGFLLASTGDTTGVPPRYRFVSWNIKDAMLGLNGGVYPLRTTALPAEASTQSLSGSGNFFTWSRPAAAGPFTVRMQDVSGGPVVFADARLYLVRVK